MPNPSPLDDAAYIAARDARQVAKLAYGAGSPEAKAASKSWADAYRSACIALHGVAPLY